MPKIIFAFDIDETLFYTSNRQIKVNSVHYTLSSYNPYGLYKFYTLHKERMAAIIARNFSQW
ncbi:hypothetical protein GW537_00975 [Piscirickettsia salmonis]|uniref:hypothetical protein n=1 Tax=Piscirickettsia salmonis TaxID=1238 RepID=UPI0012B93650|nr:hypothetical protein [Piscirickettsia salmonis]QHS24766.1 hypothetical protein GW538_00980 [Piscirickettsia salmonis]QHS27971.1 hypothetical protein GW537_00975 [Piscirickettsia salmonis]